MKKLTKKERELRSAFKTAESAVGLDKFLSGQIGITPGLFVAKRNDDGRMQVRTMDESNKRGGLVIADVFGNSADNTEANAKLLAASKDLLLALKNLLDMVQWLTDSRNIKSPIEPHPYGLAMIQVKQDARAAIAKSQPQVVG